MAYERPDVDFIILGELDPINSLMSESDRSLGNIEIQPATVMAMADRPSFAVKNPGCSISLGAQLVKSGIAAGLVSAGNTGGLVDAIAHFIGLLPGIPELALAVRFPVLGSGEVLVLDAGVGTEVNSKNLQLLAKMGLACCTSLTGIISPCFASQAPGEEAWKGGGQRMRANRAFARDYPKQYVGNREGNTLFKPDYHVMVIDGPSGNALLKGIEGFRDLIFTELRNRRDALTDEEKVMVMPAQMLILAPLQTKLASCQLGGGFFLGGEGLVVKARADRLESFMNAIRGAIQAVEADTINKIAAALA